MVDVSGFIAWAIVALGAVVVPLIMRWRSARGVAAAKRNVRAAEHLGAQLVADAEAKADAANSTAEGAADEYVEETTSGGLAAMLKRRNRRR